MNTSLGLKTLITKSLWFDWKFLSLGGLTLAHRLSLIIRKNLAILIVLINHRAGFKISPKITFQISNISDLGTLQSSIWDFYETIIQSNIFQNVDKPLVIDIGANVGQFSTASKLFLPQAEILTFEPDPLVYAKLQTNLAQLEGVQTFNQALSNQKAQLVFYRNPLSLTSSLEKNPEVLNAEEIRVQSVTGDEVFADYDKIDLLKIDVEGHEMSVLEGCWKTLQKTDYLLVEISLQRQTDKSNLELLALIYKTCPRAKIIRTSRALNGLKGDARFQSCQDFLIKLR